MFIATLSHSNKKALIITIWKVYFICVMQKDHPHVFVFPALSVVKEVVHDINTVLVITSGTLLLVPK